MGLAHWRTEEARIHLAPEFGETLHPDAMDIFRSAFQGLREIGGVSFISPVVELPHLAFSRYSAKPAIRVFEEDGQLRSQTGVMAGKCFCKIDDDADQLIVDNQWYPVQQDEYVAALEWCASLGMSGNGTLSVGALIALRARSDRPALLIDDVTATSTSMAAHVAGSYGDIRGIEGDLYPYQVEGVGFLRLIAEQSVGCILGDEMGLGKTLQVIALIQSESNAGRGPSLIIAPATLLENWRREIAKFAPSLTMHVHAGSERAGIASRLRAAAVTAVSYDTAIRDESLLASIEWNIVALDEAQNIKNPEAQRTAAVKRIPRRVSIAVTGTPLENRLEDLWSIIDFTLPGLLGALSDFQKEFGGEIEDATRVSSLVAPAILRRRVVDVAQDLPEKIEILQPLQMSTRMAQGYEQTRVQVQKEYGASAALVAMTKLRIYCAHPTLASDWFEDPALDMPKYSRLIEILDEVFSSGEKALIFSTYNGVADLLLADLPRRFSAGFFRSIDGRVDILDRQITVDQFFSHSGYGALFLNPKAAGVGLNITAANHVIHYNPEWNPALTDQATARAYRRKQERPVTVHHLYFVETIEEVMIERAAFKRQLADEAITGHEGDLEPLDIAHALQISPINSAGDIYR